MSDGMIFHSGLKRCLFFYGWVILCASTLGVLIGVPGQAVGVSAFTDYLIDNIEISRNQLSSAYLFGTVCSSFFLTWAGRLYDRYGARWTATGASLVLTFVLVLLSQSDRIIKFISNNQSSNFHTSVAVVIMTFLFFLLRFSGQGVLPMVSRNMLMKWFSARRGFVNGVLSVFVTAGFSLAPLSMNGIIQKTSWRLAWLGMAIAIGTMFIAFIGTVFRDNPHDLGMIPEGEKYANKKQNITNNPVKEFSLKEAQHTFAFWIFALSLALYTLYNAGSTIHIVSVFDVAGLERERALFVFIPVAVLAVLTSFSGGWLSDRIKLKYLLALLLTGEFIALFSLGNLDNGIFYFGFIVGHGIAGGIYSVLMAVTWPRFYGTRYLGRISGFVTSMVVFSSALGPLIFSLSFSRLGSYRFACMGLALLALCIFIGSLKGNNPQGKFVKS